eukprot:gene3943-4315_t
MAVNLEQCLMKVKQPMLSFVPFLPGDNLLHESAVHAELDSDLCLRYNLTSLTILLKLSPLNFLKQVVENDSLKELIISYLSYRKRSFTSQISLSTSSRLFKIDRKICLIYARLTGSYGELDRLAVEVDQVLHPLAVMGSSSAAVSSGDIRESYAKVVSKMEVASWPFLQGLAAVSGEGNKDLLQAIFDSFFTWRGEAMKKEISYTVLDSHAAVREAANSLLQSLSRPTSSTSVCKAVLRVGDGEESVGSTVMFLVDLVYSLATTLSCSHSTLLAEVGWISYDGVHITKPLGLTVYQSLQCIYEIVIPLIRKCYKQHKQQQEEQMMAGSSPYNLLHLLALLQHFTLLSLFRLLIHSQALIFNNNSSDVQSKASSAMSDTISWLEGLSTSLSLDDYLCNLTTAQRVWFVSGIFASDALLQMEENEEGKDALQSIVAVLLGMNPQAKVSGDVETIAYYLSSLKISESYLKSSSRQAISQYNTLESNTSSMMTTDSTATTANNLQENISMVQAIFPDYGTGFIEGCLGYFNNAEQVIDALLNDNLPPHLQGIDRKLERIAQGKNAIAVQATGGILINKEVSYKDFLNKEVENNRTFQEKQKEIVKTIEKNQAYDSYISSESGLDWMRNIEETKRYNKVVREEMADAAYWKSMENTNRQNKVSLKGNNSEIGDDSVLEEDMTRLSLSHQQHHDSQKKAGPSQHQLQQQQQQHQKQDKAKQGKGEKHSNSNAQGAASGHGNEHNHREGKSSERHPRNQSQAKEKKNEESETNQQQSQQSQQPQQPNRKPRTKMYDKHHQKDKALRKEGHFAPV